MIFELEISLLMSLFLSSLHCSRIISGIAHTTVCIIATSTQFYTKRNNHSRVNYKIFKRYYKIRKWNSSFLKERFSMQWPNCCPFQWRRMEEIGMLLEEKCCRKLVWFRKENRGNHKNISVGLRYLF